MIFSGGVFVYRGGLAIDADGCPRAYHPNGSPPGLDHLANAGHPGDWWGLACNTFQVPYIQQDDDPAPGFYVSTTALVDRTKALRDPLRYVDSAVMPYVSIPRDLTKGFIKARVGDLAVVCYASRLVGAIVADVGPVGKAGEGSMALADALGLPRDPRHGGLSSPAVSYVVFPGSFGGWPRPNFEAAALMHFASWGGQERLARELA